MSEDYKKIELEDVKKGQRIRVVERYPSITAMYEGVVVRTKIEWNEIEWNEIDLGAEGEETTIYLGSSVDTEILLLEDAPKPKVVSIDTVIVTRYDDGTEVTKTVYEGIPVPMRDNGGVEWVSAPTVIHNMEQFEAHEDYLKTKVLKDTQGDYWTYRDGQWRWAFGSLIPRVTWRTPTTPETSEDSLPMTVVENVGD